MQPLHHIVLIILSNNPYSVGHDGFNNTGIQKMNPGSISLFDVKRSKAVSDHFFNMCLTEGKDSAKSYKKFEVIATSFENEQFPWNNCVSSSVDNTNAMVGRNNSVASRFLDKNPACFVAGCPCHLAHIAASTANDAFSINVGVNVEDVCVDCYYWFDKSTKRKGKLTEYLEFCNQD